MWNPGHAHAELLMRIEEVGGVECAKMPELFFPEEIPDPAVRKSATDAAKAICSQCPIKWDCFEYATSTGQEHGIWAGTLPHER